MLASVSGLLSNTVIILLMFMLLQGVTNNQSEVWISGHKLLAFGDSRYNLHNLFTKMYIYIYIYMYIYTLFDFYN